MPVKKGYKQSEEHKRKHLEKIRGAGNGNWKGEGYSEKRKRWQFKGYQITEEGYKELRIKQDNRCKICGLQSEELFIDHCHLSGKVRGLLCNKCNIGLGFFRDSVELLEKAQEYLSDN